MSYADEVSKRVSKSGGEVALLREIRGRAAGAARGGLRLGIGDDCALLAAKRGEELAVTTDLSIAGRHFRLDWHPAEAVGHRTLARGLSDLAAMGARPVAAFLSLALPRELTTAERGKAWVEGFLDGLLGLAEAHKTPLAGGDLAESPLVVADIVLVGAVPKGQALLRSGARAGDLLYVTGSLGGAAAGLARLAAEKSAFQSDKKHFAGAKAHADFVALVARLKSCPDTKMFTNSLEAQLAAHLYPQPRIRQGIWLRQHGAASAALDLSDGLSTDLAHLCEESGVAAEVEAARLPLDPGATLAQALDGGEDYELLFAAAAGARVPRSIGGVRITQIGRVVKAGRGRAAVTLLTEAGARPLEPGGWEHFS
jgi:thiamine-monophosphate kinase